MTKYIRKCPKCRQTPVFKADDSNPMSYRFVCESCGLKSRPYGEEDRDDKAYASWCKVCDKFIAHTFEDSWDQDIELRPCPCCQGKAEKIYLSGSKTGYITCSRCGLRTGRSEAFEIVAEAWNRRMRNEIKRETDD